MTFAFDNTYSRLPERFFERLAPVPVAQPRLVKFNVALAERLGLDVEALRSPRGLAMLAAKQVPEGAALWPWPMLAINSAASCRNSAMAGRF